MARKPISVWLAYPFFSCYKKMGGDSYIRPLLTRLVSATIQLKCPFFARKKWVGRYADIPWWLKTRQHRERHSLAKRKRDWGSTMKRIRPLLAMALALALIWLGRQLCLCRTTRAATVPCGGAASVGRSRLPMRIGWADDPWRRNA